jgi:hypothetical protein
MEEIQSAHFLHMQIIYISAAASSPICRFFADCGVWGSGAQRAVPTRPPALRSGDLEGQRLSGKPETEPSAHQNRYDAVANWGRQPAKIRPRNHIFPSDEPFPRGRRHPFPTLPGEPLSDSLSPCVANARGSLSAAVWQRQASPLRGAERLRGYPRSDLVLNCQDCVMCSPLYP